MKVAIQLSLTGEIIRTITLDVPDDKLELLSEEEVEAAIEMRVRRWADDHLQLKWEVIEADAGEEAENDG